MARRTLMLFVLVAAFAATAPAQNNRSAVSLLGSDANPCTTTAPCRSFGAAMAQTNPGGEIIALDTAGYGAFTIDRPITVSGAPGIHAALTITTGVGISINVSSGDRVVLRNLVLISGGGSTGIDIPTAAETRVFDCVVRGFTFAGINMSAAGGVSVDRCTIIENGTYGINVGSTTTTPARATINDSLIAGNNLGIVAEQYSAIVVVGSRLTGNATGAEATSTVGVGSAPADMTLERCAIINNTANGVFATSVGGNNVARIAISQDVFAFNNTAVNSSGTGTVSSFQNNRFTRNGSDGTFGTVAFQ